MRFHVLARREDKQVCRAFGEYLVPLSWDLCNWVFSSFSFEIILYSFPLIWVMNAAYDVRDPELKYCSQRNCETWWWSVKRVENLKMMRRRAKPKTCAFFFTTLNFFGLPSISSMADSLNAYTWWYFFFGLPSITSPAVNLRCYDLPLSRMVIVSCRWFVNREKILMGVKFKRCWKCVIPSRKHLNHSNVYSLYEVVLINLVGGGCKGFKVAQPVRDARIAQTLASSLCRNNVSFLRYLRSFVTFTSYM